MAFLALYLVAAVACGIIVLAAAWVLVAHGSGRRLRGRFAVATWSVVLLLAGAAGAWLVSAMT